MTLLHVISRGIRYRPGRSIVVLALAAIATAAAVMTPAYTAAAHQSLLTDALADIPDGLDGAVVAVGGHHAATDDVYFDKVHTSIEKQVAGDDALSPLRDPVRFADAPVAVSGADWPARAHVTYRDGLCEHLRMIEGGCRTGDGEVLISRRSADFEGVSLGDTVDLGDGDDDGETVEVTIAGIYEPRDTAAGYWGTSHPFRHGDSPVGDRLDALFVTDSWSVAAANRPVEIGVEYGLDVASVRLGNASALSDALAALEDRGGTAGRPLETDSRLAGTFKEVRAEQDSVSSSVPMVTVPLLLLSWFVLYLVVARLSEERSPQIALTKLRGHRFTSVTGFGTGEAALLVVVGTPVGIGLGWALVRVVAWLELADGATAALTPELAVYGLVALMGGWAAALAASYPVLARPVLALLRRVPPRGDWRAGLFEGALVALAAVAVWQVLASPDAGTIGLLVTPLLALVVGVAAARLLELAAKRRLPKALRKARLARLLALAQVSRRPETRRMVVLVTIASAVVTFGVCAWDVAEHNRNLTATDELGADRVYTLSGGSPGSVMAAVEAVDPGGEHLMAVLRRVDRFDNKDFTTIAAQTDRLSQVADWRDMPPHQLADLAAELHPEFPDPLRVEREITVDADVGEYRAARTPSLVAKVVPDGGTPVTVRLGTLSEGTGSYSATVDECADGCRLVGVGVSRHPGDVDGVAAEVTVTAISDADGDIGADLSDCDGWRRSADLRREHSLTLDCSNGLTLSVDSDEPEEYLAEYASNPRDLPVALAGAFPADDTDGDRFTAMGPQRELQRYERVEAVPVVPRGGARAMLVDLEYTALAAQDDAALTGREDLRFEVWADETAGDDVAAELAEQGLVVVETEDRSRLLERLGRAAPALSLRLYLVAAGLALLLVVGTVLLTATVGAAVRGYDNAALSVAGVGRDRLRAAAIREHVYWIVFPALAGIGVGLGGLAMVLPSVPLVRIEPPEVAVAYTLRPVLPPAALALLTAALAVVVWLAVRIGLRRGAARRLRDGGS